MSFMKMWYYAFDKAGDSVINIVYLLKILGTDKLSELVAAIDAAPIDINLAIWEAVESGYVEVDEKKDRIKVLQETRPSCDEALADKLLGVVRHYCDNEVNITKARLSFSIQDPMTRRGYPMYEYLMALQWLIDSGAIIEEKIKVPGAGKRPYREFEFLGLPGRDNESWNYKAIQEWIANWKKTK